MVRIIDEKSCGAVVFFEQDDKITYLIVKHNKESGGHWGLPKGRMKKEEIETETAAREVLEETGIEIDLIEIFREEIFYDCKTDIYKEVVYFLAKARGNVTRTQHTELDDSKFVSYDGAMILLTYDNTKDILKKAKDTITKNA